MPLSVQEQKCVESACRFLAVTRGGNWYISPGPTLDDQYPHQPSPEVIVTDGTVDVAVEVKGLSDDCGRPYFESVLSLDLYLAPACGGYYTLLPCANLRFPLDRKLMRHLKREINRVAPSMQDDDTRPIVIPRTSQLEVRGRTGPSLFHCCHSDFDLMHDISNRVDGIYGLIADQGQMEHMFVTDNMRERFAQAVIAAAKSGDSQCLSWEEEWELARIHGNDAGVYVFGNSGAFDVQTSVSVSAERMIEQALKKFAGRRWAAKHILVLESQSPHMTPDRVHKALLAFGIEELQELDQVLLVVDGEAHLVWAK